MDQTVASKEFHKLLEDSWEFTLAENPVFASGSGDPRYHDRLPSVKEADLERRTKKDREFLERLKKISPQDLSSQDQENYDMFQLSLEEDLREVEFKTYLMPITNVWGFHILLPELSNRAPMLTVKNYENYLSRLEQSGTYMDDHLVFLKKGMKEGYMPAEPAISGCQASIESQIVPAEKSPVFRPFQNFPSTFPEQEKNRLREKGKDVIEKTILPAYRRLLEFFKKEYYPKARKEIGALALPRGKEFYAHRVQMYTAPGYTPEFIHETGKKEVERIHKEMLEIIAQVGFKGSYDEFVHFLRTNPQFYVSNPQDLLKEVSYLLKRMEGKLPQMFKTLPRMTYGICPVPEYSAPKAPTAYYMPPTGDGSRAGFYYVNTYDLKSRPLYELETLSYHEAVPGHHLQIALQQELKNLPNFRRFSHFMAYMEGWALYSERLGLEAGFFENPYYNFGRLIYEVWRACRLVVDTGIHYFGWSRDEAVSYMKKNTALSELNINSEVDRYIAWPGQALSYKMGELKLQSLRKKAQETLQDAFDLREFHDVVLGSGAIPLSLLEKNINAYIERNKKK